MAMREIGSNGLCNLLVTVSETAQAHADHSLAVSNSPLSGFSWQPELLQMQEHIFRISVDPKRSGAMQLLFSIAA